MLSDEYESRCVCRRRKLPTAAQTAKRLKLNSLDSIPWKSQQEKLNWWMVD
jgi:hypothetical protein